MNNIHNRSGIPKPNTKPKINPVLEFVDGKSALITIKSANSSCETIKLLSCKYNCFCSSEGTEIKSVIMSGIALQEEQELVLKVGLLSHKK